MILTGLAIKGASEIGKRVIEGIAKKNGAELAQQILFPLNKSYNPTMSDFFNLTPETVLRLGIAGAFIIGGVLIVNYFK